MLIELHTYVYICACLFTVPLKDGLLVTLLGYLPSLGMKPKLC